MTAAASRRQPAAVSEVPGGWLASATRSDVGDVSYGLLLRSDAARHFRSVEATGRDGVGFGDPVVDGDRLLVPEFGDDELVAVTALG